MPRLSLLLSLLTLPLFVLGCGGYGGLSPEDAKAKAEDEIARLNPTGTSLVFDHLEKGQDSLTRDAWLAYFQPPSRGWAAYSGCIVYVRDDSAEATKECSSYRASGG